MESSLIYLILGLNYTLMGNIIYPSLPGIQEMFGLSAIQLSLMASMPAFINILFQPIAGWISDRVYRKGIVMAGLLAYFIGGSLAALILLFWSGFAQILVCRIIMGIGELGAFPQYIALIKENLPEVKHRSALGWMESFTSIGGAIGPTIGGFMVSLYLGMPFLGTSIFALATLFLAYRFLPKKGISQRRELKNKSQFWLEIKNLIHNPSYIGGFITIGTLVTVQVFIGSYVFSILKFNSILIGLTLACVPLAMAVGSIITTRHGHQRDISNKSFVISGGIAFLGIVLIAVTNLSWVVFCALFLVGSVLGYWLPFFDHSAAGEGGTKNSGLNLSFFQQSKSFGVLVIPTLFAIVNDVSNSVRTAFGFLSLLFLLCVFLAYTLKKNRPVLSGSPD